MTTAVLLISVLPIPLPPISKSSGQRSTGGTRQGFDRADEIAHQIVRLADAELRHPVQQLVEDLAELHFRKEVAHAEVRATTAEPEVRIGVAGDVEAVRVGEDALVPVAGRVDHR